MSVCSHYNPLFIFFALNGCPACLRGYDLKLSDDLIWMSTQPWKVQICVILGQKNKNRFESLQFNIMNVSFVFLFFIYLYKKFVFLQIFLRGRIWETSTAVYILQCEFWRISLRECVLSSHCFYVVSLA